MKTIIRVLSSIIALHGCIASASPEKSQTYIFVVARDLPSEQAKESFTASLHFVSGAPAGSIIKIADPVSQAITGSFKVPEGTLRQRVRDRSFASGIKALQAAFLKTSSPEEWSRTALSLSHSLRLVASSVPSSEGDITLLLFGNPLNLDRQEALNFSGGRAPNSAWLYNPVSPFYVNGLPSLKNWRVFMVPHATDWMASNWQLANVTAFWSLMFSEKGAVFVAIGPAAYVFEQVKSGFGEALPPMKREPEITEMWLLAPPQFKLVTKSGVKEGL